MAEPRSPSQEKLERTDLFAITVRMREPSLRSSRLIIAGGLTILIAAGAAGFLAGRTTAPDTAPAPAPTATPVPRPIPKVEPPRVLDRGGLVSIVDHVADLTASGAPLDRSVTSLVGRRFELVLPFGCSGPASRDSREAMRWNYDDAEKTLRVNVTARRWNLSDWGFGDGQDRDAQAEGFWISRPWSSSDRCPQHTGHAAASASDPITLPGQTMAIAQIQRQGAGAGAGASEPRPPRSFNTVKRIVGERLNSADGFRMRLTGRIDRLPNGQPVSCVQPAGFEQRPICIVAATFEEAMLESSAANEVLATWSLGGAVRAD
jgi:hypothetical protein